MKNSILLTLVIALLWSIPPVLAEEDCTDEGKAALDVCLTECATACKAAHPDCPKPLVSLEELQSAIAEKCDCASAKNFGQYRSCVAKIMGALREFNLIEVDTNKAIQADNAACRKEIMDKKRADKGKGKVPGKGKPEENV